MSRARTPRSPRRDRDRDRRAYRARGTPMKAKHKGLVAVSRPRPRSDRSAPCVVQYPHYDHRRPETWPTHLSRFEFALVANCVRDPDQKKALLACTLDELTFSRLGDWLPAGESLHSASYEQVVAALCDHIKPASRAAAYATFTGRLQGAGERAEAYMAALQQLVQGVEAGGFADALVTLQFVVGLASATVRQQVRARPEQLSAVEVLGVAVAAERAEAHDEALKATLMKHAVKREQVVHSGDRAGPRPTWSSTPMGPAAVKLEPMTPCPPLIHVPEEALLKVVNKVLGEKPEMSRKTPQKMQQKVSRKTPQKTQQVSRKTPQKIQQSLPKKTPKDKASRMAARTTPNKSVFRRLFSKAWSRSGRTPLKQRTPLRIRVREVSGFHSHEAPLRELSIA